jgi:hypothetical protein
MMTDISPQDISVDTSQTQETSTISDSMANPEQAFARMCIQNPDFLERFLRSNPEIKAVIPGAVQYTVTKYGSSKCFTK